MRALLAAAIALANEAREERFAPIVGSLRIKLVLTARAQHDALTERA